MRVKIINVAMLLVSVLFFSSCEDTYTPKPRGFQRIEFPAKKYVAYTNDCGFSCELPDYAIVFPDYSMQQEKCWFNIFYRPYNATLHISFKKVSKAKELNSLADDAHTLVYKHTVKADEIFETYIEKENLRGMVYDISGNTATNFQFYVTDTVSNYLRGALYFNERTNPDSVAPVLEYLKKDVYKMIETIQWKN